MNRLPEIIGLTLWLVLFVVFVIREEVFPKHLPSHILRYPRYPAVLGVGTPFVSGWLIYEMLCASDWEKMRLLYLLIQLFPKIVWEYIQPCCTTKLSLKQQPIT